MCSNNNNNNTPEPGQLSYEEIIECIQEDKKVPNMVDVPDIIHSSDSISQSTMPMRRKPWEVQQTEMSADDTATTEDLTIQSNQQQ